MPSTYTSNLGIELPADGELDGVWGDVVNDNMSIIDRATNGSVTLTLSGTSSTLTTSDGTLSDGQYKLLVLGGSPSGTHTITIAPSDAQKIYFVRNTTAQSVVFTQGSGGNVTVAAGDSAIIYSDGAGAGAAVVNVSNDFAMSSVKITGGTIDGTTIGGTTPAAGTFTTANATTVDTTNLEVTTLKAKDGTAAGSIADSTGVVTLASSVLTTTDINGGTIDGTVIGGSSAAAGTFTTVTASGDLTIADKIVHDGDTNTSIRFPAADTVTVETSGAERLRVDSSGNVGIGNTAPSAKLMSQVNTFTDADKVALKAYNAQGVGAYASFQNSATGTAFTDGFRIGIDDSENAVLQNLEATNMLFATSATERMRIDSSGNVGIGTSSPTANLQIGASPSADRTFQIGSAGATRFVVSTDGTNGLTNIGCTNDSTTGRLAFRTGSALTERMRIDESGNVGIGTSVPSDYNASADNLVVGTTSGNNGITIAAGTASQGSLFFADGTANATEEAAGYLAYVHSDDSMRVGTANTERMRINSLGNVGIGTSSPATLGSNITTVTVNGTAGGGIQFQRTDATAVTGLVAALSGAFALGSITNTDVTFRTNNTERMRIDASGNVGIGTGSPIYTLDVRGQAGIELYDATTSGKVLNFRPSLGDANKYNMSISAFDHSGGGTSPADGLSINGFDGVSIATGSSTARQERMRIDSSGNVIFGNGDTSATPAAATLRGTNASGTDIAAANMSIVGGRGTGTGAGGALIFSTAAAGTTGTTLNAATERMRIDSTGRVGIGTTSMFYDLDVRNTTASATMSVQASTGNAVVRASSVSSGTARLDLISSPGTQSITGGVGSVNNMVFSVNATERMRIDSAGNVGIGTSSPSTKLDVSEAGTLTARVINTASTDVAGFNATNTTGTALFGVDATGVFTYTGTALPIRFSTSATERVRITSTGNVGIGTGTPATLLSLQAATPTLTSVSTTTTGTTLGNKGNRVLLQANSSTIGNGGELVWAAADTDTGRWGAISGHIVTNASGSATGDIVFATKSLSSDTALSERMRITSGGALVFGNGDTSASPAATFLRATGGSGTDIAGASMTIQGGRGTGTGAGGALIFSTAAAGTTGTTLNAATERARIDSSGNLLVGTTSNTASTAGFKWRQDLSRLILVADGGTPASFGRLTSDGDVVLLQRSGTTVGSISVTTTATAYNTSSDYRLKEDVQPMVGASHRVRQLNPVNFAWKADGTRTDGFIAHEVQAVAPQAVTGEKDGEEMQAIDHSKLVPLLTAALQEALTEIALLKARLDAANI